MEKDYIIDRHNILFETDNAIIYYQSGLWLLTDDTVSLISCKRFDNKFLNNIRYALCQFIKRKDKLKFNVLDLIFIRFDFSNMQRNYYVKVKSYATYTEITSKIKVYDAQEHEMIE